MIQKKKFSEAIAANISVVEGLMTPLIKSFAQLGALKRFGFEPTKSKIKLSCSGTGDFIILLKSQIVDDSALFIISTGSRYLLQKVGGSNSFDESKVYKVDDGIVFTYSGWGYMYVFNMSPEKNINYNCTFVTT